MAALGLLLLVVAGATAAITGLANSGSDHLAESFSIVGFDVREPTGRLFIYGAIVGAVGMLGFNMLLAGIGRGFKNRIRTRKELRAEHDRAESATAERDQLAGGDYDNTRIDLNASPTPEGRHYAPTPRTNQ